MKIYVVACGKYYFQLKNTASKEIILKPGFVSASMFTDLNKAKEIAQSLGGKVKQITLVDLQQ